MQLMTVKRMRPLLLYILLVACLLCGCHSTSPSPSPSPLPDPRDITKDSPLASSIVHAADIANGVQAHYGDNSRTDYILENQNAVLVNRLTESKLTSLYSLSGEAYFTDTLDYFITDTEGNTYYASRSEHEGRANTLRLGYYYYDSHVYDLTFDELGQSLLYLDKAAHFYSDKYHQEMRILAEGSINHLAAMGMEIVLPKSAVANRIDEEGYCGFDIEGTGVLGFIMRADGQEQKEIEETGDSYILHITKPLREKVSTGFEDSISVRIHTDETHDFTGLEAAAKDERTPMSDIQINGSNPDHARFIRYNSIRGMYEFDMDGSDFNQAFYREPNHYYTANVSMGNNEIPRSAYIWFHTDNECLECAALTSGDDVLQPIPLQVAKNFQMEMEEPVYDSTDAGYGDTVFPLVWEAGETLDFKLMNLYQNWGITPLKQLSSIQFFSPYYHLSTGASESNCICPNYLTALSNDTIVLPDFRCRSGILWSGQPQYNSVGSPSFVSSENYIRSDIVSSGPTYADISYAFTCDGGTPYTYTLRHVEFPQIDENRTYYSILVNFTDTGKTSNANAEFSLCTFDSTDTTFDNAAYLNTNGEEVRLYTLDLFRNNATYTGTLNPEGGYIGLYNMNGSSASFRGCNVTYIVKNISGVLGGKDYTGGVKFRLTVNNKNGSAGFSLSPNVDELDYQEGDWLKLDVILLPWGSDQVEGNETAREIRRDSVLFPAVISDVALGEVILDTWVPTVKCENNRAEFTLSGGRDNRVVRVCGFDDLIKPTIETKASDGSWKPWMVGENEYDGYTVFYNKETGLYDYAFPISLAGSYRITAAL